MWLQETSKAERKTLVAAFAGYGVDAFDYMIYTFLSGFTTSPGQLLVTRAPQGLGFGGEWSVGPVLIAALALPETQGLKLAAGDEAPAGNA